MTFSDFPRGRKTLAQETAEHVRYMVLRTCDDGGDFSGSYEQFWLNVPVDIKREFFWIIGRILMECPSWYQGKGIFLDHTNNSVECPRQNQVGIFLDLMKNSGGMSHLISGRGNFSGSYEQFRFSMPCDTRWEFLWIIRTILSNVPGKTRWEFFWITQTIPVERQVSY